MISELLAWFDSISFYYVLAIPPILFILELIVSTLVSNQARKRLYLINAWQILGVLFPAIWLIRCATNYYQASIVVLILIFFGVFKPTKLKKDESTYQT